MIFHAEPIFVFVLGAIVGSFLNVCIYRLPLEKSLIWPGSRCGNCLQPVRWYDNIPLISYWVLGGRCRVCGQEYSIRYFLIELLTAGGFLGLYYLEVIRNVHGLDRYVLGEWRYVIATRVILAVHALLLSFLIVATFCDFDYQIIPLPLTITGTLVGLLIAVSFPWPWPYTPLEARALPVQRVAWWRVEPEWMNPRHPNVVRMGGIYPWPVWGPLPEWLGPGDNWKTGLATGLAGLLAGTLVLRAIRFFFGIGGGAEYSEPVQTPADEPPVWFGRRWLSWVGRIGGRAMGLGDADLMMMAGTFMGWQLVIVAFFIGVIPGLFFGLAQMVFRGGNVMPFGPSLAIGVMLTALSWRWIGPYVQPAFFNGQFVLVMGAGCCVAMVLLAYLMRLAKMARS
jgi:leader peptidase (prepilin peptidase)/N-methyltransferase